MATALLTLPSASLAVTPAERTWDLGADFRAGGAQLNPSPDRYGNPGVWRYGHEPESTPGTGFSLLPAFTGNDGGFYNLDDWNNGLYELIGRNNGGPQACNPSRGTCSIATGDMLVHPDHGNSVIARWTSPTAGTVRVAGSVLDSDQFGTGQNWILRGPAGTLASGVVAAATPGGAEDVDTFDFQVPVSAGGVVDLVIGSNGGNITSDTTEVVMTITRPFSDCNIANAITDNGAGDTDPAVGVITGGSGDDTLVGSAGAETLNGGGGADELCGGDGNDTLNGGPGVDGLDGGIGNDTLDGGTEDDTLRGGSGDDVIRGGGGSDIIEGSTGLDRVDYSAAPSAITIASASGTSATGDGTGVQDVFDGSVEAVTASPFSDSITGMRVIAGLAGNDTMVGTASDDFFAGYDGTDTYDGGAGGTDRVSHTSNTSAQPISSITLNAVANDSDGRGATTENYTSIEYVFGGAGNDFIDGTLNPTGVSLWGRGGNDTLWGSLFDDVLRGDEGSNALDCNSGPNDMFTSTGTDIVQPNCETSTAYSRNGSVTPIS